MLSTSGASVISCVFHTQHTSRTTKSDAGPANRQPPTLSRQDGCVCSDTLPVLVHPKTTDALYEQPSVVCLRTGDAHLVDQDEPGFEQLSSTSSSTILASTWRGSVHRIVPSGANLWRQLCPAKDAPPDDDDDVAMASALVDHAQHQMAPLSDCAQVVLSRLAIIMCFLRYDLSLFLHSLVISHQLIASNTQDCNNYFVYYALAAIKSFTNKIVTCNTCMCH